MGELTRDHKNGVMICATILSLSGLMGLGHIYLKKTVLGIVFLIIGLMMVAVIITSELLDLGSMGTLGVMFDLLSTGFVFAYIILAIVSIVHLHRYAKSLVVRQN